MLRTIKNEITEELRELQSDVIFIKDAKNRIRNFQSILAERVKSYFNHKQERRDLLPIPACNEQTDKALRYGETVRKIKTPHDSFATTHLPRVDSFDNFFDESFSKETLEENHHKRIEDLRRRVKEYFEKDLLKDEGMPEKWRTDSRTLDIPSHAIDKFRFNAICSQTVFNNLIDIGDVSDYVISCMYQELSRINTWQYASNKFLRTDSIYVPLSASMEDGEKPYTEYHDFKDPETKLSYPLSSNYEYADLMSFQLKTNYKLPRLIGIACKKEAANNVHEIDYLLGISL